MGFARPIHPPNLEDHSEDPPAPDSTLRRKGYSNLLIPKRTKRALKILSAHLDQTMIKILDDAITSIAEQKGIRGIWGDEERAA